MDVLADIDADALLMDILRAAILDPVTVNEVLPADYLSRLPIATARRWGGAAVDQRFLDRAMVDVNAYAETRTAALDLGMACRNALYQAWRQHRVYAHGSVAHFKEISAPVELPDAHQPDRVVRVQATYQLHLCPPA